MYSWGCARGRLIYKDCRGCVCGIGESLCVCVYWVCVWEECPCKKKEYEGVVWGYRCEEMYVCWVYVEGRSVCGVGEECVAGSVCEGGVCVVGWMSIYLF